MKESIITGELLTFLRAALRGVVLKHNDDSTIAIPDISVTSGGTTQWIEVKLVKFKKASLEFDLAKIVDFGKPQSQMCGKLDLHGHCHYVIFFTNGPVWWTYIKTAVAVANLCHAKTPVYLIRDATQRKDFERVLNQLKVNMRGDRL